MKIYVKNLALTLLVSWGVTACSSGSSEQPGEDAQTVSLRNANVANQEKIAQLEQQNSELLAEKNALQTANATLETTKIELENAKATLEKQKQDLEAQIASGLEDSTEVQGLKSQIAEKSKQVSDLQSTIASQAETISTLTKKVASLTLDAEEKVKAEQEAALAAQKAQEEKEAAEAALAEKLVAEEAAKKAADETAKQEVAAKEAEAQRLAEQQAKEAEAAKNKLKVEQVATSYFADKTDSAVYAYVTDSAKNAELISKIESTTNTTASCTGAKSDCRAGVETGTVIVSNSQAYSGYAAIRETYIAADAKNNVVGTSSSGIPANSFVYYVKTPTTNKEAVVNATYKGQLSYSRQNAVNVVHNNDLTMVVNGEQINGKATSTTNSGTVSDVITFNTGNIVSTENGVTFSGSATFHSKSFGNKGDLSGIYQGAFAGSNAEEVVGKFESTSTEKDKSVQGAFSAKK